MWGDFFSSSLEKTLHFWTPPLRNIVKHGRNFRSSAGVYEQPVGESAQVQGFNFSFFTKKHKNFKNMLFFRSKNRRPKIVNFSTTTQKCKNHVFFRSNCTKSHAKKCSEAGTRFSKRWKTTCFFGRNAISQKRRRFSNFLHMSSRQLHFSDVANLRFSRKNTWFLCENPDL